MSLDEALSDTGQMTRQKTEILVAPSTRRLSQSVTCQFLACADALLLAGLAAWILFPSARVPAVTDAYAIEAAITIGIIAFLTALFTGAAGFERFASRRALLPGALLASVFGGLAALLGNAEWLYALLAAASLSSAVYVTRILSLIAKSLLERSGRLTRLVAVLSDDPARMEAVKRSLSERPDISVVFTGTPADLAPLDMLVRKNHLDEIVLADAWAQPEQVSLLADLPVTLVQVAPDILPHRRPTRLTWGKTRFDGPWNAPALVLSQPPLKGWNAAAKRIIDFSGAVAAMLLLGIPMLLVALAIRLESPGPALFVQERVGFRNKRFRMYKFRSMRNDRADSTGALLTQPNDPRVTKVGSFIRRTSIDELPQVLNVLLGDMSLVGPRPHPLAAKAGGVLYDDLIPNFYSRYRMKPGITGLAQVSGLRGNTETEKSLTDRFAKDVEYADAWTPALDIVIIFRTVKHLFEPTNAF